MKKRVRKASNKSKMAEVVGKAFNEAINKTEIKRDGIGKGSTNTK